MDLRCVEMVLYCLEESYKELEYNQYMETLLVINFIVLEFIGLLFVAGGVNKRSRLLGAALILVGVVNAINALLC